MDQGEPVPVLHEEASGGVHVRGDRTRWRRIQVHGVPIRILREAQGWCEMSFGEGDLHERVSELEAQIAELKTFIANRDKALINLSRLCDSRTEMVIEIDAESRLYAEKLCRIREILDA